MQDALLMFTERIQEICDELGEIEGKRYPKDHYMMRRKRSLQSTLETNLIYYGAFVDDVYSEKAFTNLFGYNPYKYLH